MKRPKSLSLSLIFLCILQIAVLKSETVELLLLEYGFTAKFREQAFDISARYSTPIIVSSFYTSRIFTMLGTHSSEDYIHV